MADCPASLEPLWPPWRLGRMLRCDADGRRRRVAPASLPRDACPCHRDDYHHRPRPGLHRPTLWSRAERERAWRTSLGSLRGSGPCLAAGNPHGVRGPKPVRQAPLGADTVAVGKHCRIRPAVPTRFEPASQRRQPALRRFSEAAPSNCCPECPLVAGPDGRPRTLSPRQHGTRRRTPPRASGARLPGVRQGGRGDPRVEATMRLLPIALWGRCSL